MQIDDEILNFLDRNKYQAVRIGIPKLNDLVCLVDAFGDFYTQTVENLSNKICLIIKSYPKIIIFRNDTEIIRGYLKDGEIVPSNHFLGYSKDETDIYKLVEQAISWRENSVNQENNIYTWRIYK